MSPTPMRGRDSSTSTTQAHELVADGDRQIHARGRRRRLAVSVSDREGGRSMGVRRRRRHRRSGVSPHRPQRTRCHRSVPRHRRSAKGLCVRRPRRSAVRHLCAEADERQRQTERTVLAVATGRTRESRRTVHRDRGRRRLSEGCEGRTAAVSRLCVPSAHGTRSGGARRCTQLPEGWTVERRIRGGRVPRRVRAERRRRRS